MAGLKCPHENLPLHKMKLVVGAPAFMRGKERFSAGNVKASESLRESIAEEKSTAL